MPQKFCYAGPTLKLRLESLRRRIAAAGRSRRSGRSIEVKKVGIEFLSFSCRNAAEVFVPDTKAMQVQKEGEILHANHLIGASLEKFAQAAFLAPTWAVSLRALGVALFQVGQRSASVRCLKTALRLDPAARSTYYTLSEALRGLNEPIEAIKITTVWFLLFFLWQFSFFFVGWAFTA